MLQSFIVWIQKKRFKAIRHIVESQELQVIEIELKLSWILVVNLKHTESKVNRKVKAMP